MTMRLSLGKDGETGHRVGRRRFLGGMGAGGLATAAAVFGFTPDASALVDEGCCTLFCKPTHNLSQCETGSHYVWECTESGGFLYCNCCEHGNPGAGCNSSNYSSYSCQYP